MASSPQLLRSEDLEGDSQWYADGQGCAYVNFVDFSENDVQCDKHCLYVFSTASFVTQSIDVSGITPEVLGKPFVLSFQSVARKLALTDPDGMITISVSDGPSSTTLSMPLNSINSTDARFVPQRFTFNLPQNARDGMNIAMKLREPGTPNRATLYFDQLSLKLDPDYIIVIPPKTTPIGAIVGGVIGGIAVLLALVAFVYLVIRRRRRANPPARELHSAPDEPTTSVNNLLSNQLLTVPARHSGEPSINSAQRDLRSPLHHHATSMSGGSEPWTQQILPAYDTSGEPPTSPTDLESFAQLNRNSIDANLLDKLRRAGYSPLQNPNMYTEEQWSQQFNVSKFEYQRLCDAYARNNERAQPSSSN